jgi:glycosyltransferase involved in cell wall biosynthesis
MAADSRLRFVSVGGALAGCDAYERFRQMVGTSAHADRFHLLGWQPVSEVAGYYSDADFGITLDAACYEAELGTRTRLVEMMQHGLPIVTTEACELSRVISREGLGLTFSIGDPEGLSRQVLALSRDAERASRMGEAAKHYVTTTLSLESSTAALLAWAKAPRRAPDRQPPTADEVYIWRHSLRAHARQVAWGFAGLDQ